MRIALFLSEARGGGAQRRMFALARGFRALGAEVELLFAAHDGSPVPEAGDVPVRTLRPRATANGAPRRLLWVPRALPALCAYLRRTRPDALLSTSIPANLTAIAAVRAAGCGTALVVSANLHLKAALGRNGGRLLALPRLIGRCYRQADAVVAISEGVAEDLRRWMGERGPLVATVQNPVDVDRIRSLARSTPADPQLSPQHRPYLLGCGKLRSQKDFATLLRAFARVARVGDLDLVVLGEGPERPRLLRLAAALGIAERVRFPGFVANPYPWMARARLFVLSSRFEGASNVLLEALALGLPIVATDCPSGPREILAGGRYGMLVPVGRPEAMAAAILQQLREPGGAEMRIARARSYSVEKAARAYLDTIRAAVQKRCAGTYPLPLAAGRIR